MFEAELSSKLQQIFHVKKVTYDAPSENVKEQETLFLEIENSKNVIKDKKAKAMVTGNGVMFGQNDKMPFGFFSKAIRQADNSLTKDLFFFDIEVNSVRFNNIVQRGFSFVYFFDSQYDPNVGTITSIELEETIT